MNMRYRESAAGRPSLSKLQHFQAYVFHVLENWFFRICLPGFLVQKKYTAFQRLRHGDRQALERISKLEEIKQRRQVCDFEYIKHLCRQLDREVEDLVHSLTAFNPLRYAVLENYHRKYVFYVQLALLENEPAADPPYVLPLSQARSEELAGGKASTLATLLQDHDLPIPSGLVLTTRAFHLFLQANELWPLIQEQLVRLSPEGMAEIETVSHTIQTAILQAELPRSLRHEVRRLWQQSGLEATPLAVRSSAVGEDVQASFAGQFESFLRVDPDQWAPAYKRVVASKYSPHALSYRMRQGMSERMTPMAVLLMPLIQPRVSGILYTRERDNPSLASLYMVSGSGERLAAGQTYQGMATFDPDRQALAMEQALPELDQATLTRLFQLGQTLDKAAGQAQDVEWVVDQQGRIHIVQSRPLRMSASKSESASTYPDHLIMARGQWVSSGQASGPVYRLQDPRQAAKVPSGVILVTDQLPPGLTLALTQAAGIVAARGSPACHFASVAREAGVPALCNAPQALELPEGQTVSLDSDSGLVLAGDLFSQAPVRSLSPKPEKNPVRVRLDRALQYIAPLHLQDPESRDFSIRACQSLHDIVRYVHESGVREMFSLVGRRGLNAYGAKRLLSDIPLVLHILDVQSGLSPEAKKSKTVTLNQVTCQPMRHLFAGLSSPAVKWDTNILHYDWDAFAKSSVSLVDVAKSTLFSSYAIVAQEYLHALLRFGYHFAVLDSVQGRDSEHNYIHFSFKGGGGDSRQRFMRIELISQVLEHYQFSVQVTSDLLEASFSRHSLTQTGHNLHRLGIVLGKTVLLDMRLQSEDQVTSLTHSIIDETNDSLPVQEPGQ